MSIETIAPPPERLEAKGDKNVGKGANAADLQVGIGDRAKTAVAATDQCVAKKLLPDCSIDARHGAAAITNTPSEPARHDNRDGSYTIKHQDIVEAHDTHGQETNFKLDLDGKVEWVSQPSGKSLKQKDGMITEYDANGARGDSYPGKIELNPDGSGSYTVTDNLSKSTTHYNTDGTEHRQNLDGSSTVHHSNIVDAVFTDKSTATFTLDPKGNVAWMREPDGTLIHQDAEKELLTVHHIHDKSPESFHGGVKLNHDGSFVVDDKSSNIIQAHYTSGAKTTFFLDSTRSILSVTQPDHFSFRQNGDSVQEYNPTGHPVGEPFRGSIKLNSDGDGSYTIIDTDAKVSLEYDTAGGVNSTSDNP